MGSSRRRKADHDAKAWKHDQASDASEAEDDHIIADEEAKMYPEDAETLIERGEKSDDVFGAIHNILKSNEDGVQVSDKVSDVGTDTDHDSEFSNSDTGSSFVGSRSVTPAPGLRVGFKGFSAGPSSHQYTAEVSSPRVTSPGSLGLHSPTGVSNADVGPAHGLLAGGSPYQYHNELSSPRLTSPGSFGLRSPTGFSNVDLGPAHGFLAGGSS
ncbi:hypothetical protein BDN72DRAFT_866480, partial [Pluteus cervinus]